jgi:hypothetical protein
MLFKIPIMLCSNSQHQANYAHCFVPTMLLISLNFFIFYAIQSVIIRLETYTS